MADEGLSSVASDAIARSNKVIGQLGSWTLLGNAAGIGFILATARDSKLPTDMPIETAYVTFLVGLICAFLGYLFNAMCVALVGNAAIEASNAFSGIDHRVEMRRLLNEAGKEIPTDYAEQDRKDEAILAKDRPDGVLPFAIIGVLLFVASVAALGVGLSLPLFYGFN